MRCQHLKVLRDAGLVRGRVDGRRRPYQVDRDGLERLRSDGRLGVPPESTAVEIDLVEQDGATTVRLVHHGLPSETVRDHQRGWAYFLDTLQAPCRPDEPARCPSSVTSGPGAAPGTPYGTMG